MSQVAFFDKKSKKINVLFERIFRGIIDSWRNLLIFSVCGCQWSQGMGQDGELPVEQHLWRYRVNRVKNGTGVVQLGSYINPWVDVEVDEQPTGSRAGCSLSC